MQQILVDATELLIVIDAEQAVEHTSGDSRYMAQCFQYFGRKLRHMWRGCSERVIASNFVFKQQKAL